MKKKDCCQKLRQEISQWLLILLVIAMLSFVFWLVGSLNYSDGLYAGRKAARSTIENCEKSVRLSISDVREYYGEGKIDYDTASYTTRQRLYEGVVYTKIMACIKEVY